MTLALPRRAAGVLALGLLAGCGNQPAPPFAMLPPNPANPLADPARQAILHTAYVFAVPGRLGGNAAEAAQAISEAEFLAVELRYGSRWIEMQPIAQMAFEQARLEWRSALGIDLAADPQAVIDALTRLRIGLGAQDSAAAAAALRPPLATPGGASVLGRLDALPALPRTAWAASIAQQEMMRMDRQGTRDGWE
ncbi:hypothetical protein [Roseomonas rosulenta]|uniref:hypothetical protein n=1 Tax=Roseomonas rosulenta TaxID=2748667 RepID=UPI0018DFCBD1|nr:hypothetical protein [Roseomonas rosulenta]